MNDLAKTKPHALPCAIVVMAKAPVAGFAKTRLIPALGAEGAAALAQRMLLHTLTQALAANIGPVWLACAPDAAHPAFVATLDALADSRRMTQAQASASLPCFAQGQGDLGERMHRAFETVLAQQAQLAGALLIGTDVPGLDATVLQAAAAALQKHDAVLVPALDGGYALIGLRQPQASLFDGMVWSTPSVMQHTRERLAAAGLRHVELAPLADIDEPHDLRHVPSVWKLGVWVEEAPGVTS